MKSQLNPLVFLLYTLKNLDLTPQNKLIKYECIWQLVMSAILRIRPARWVSASALIYNLFIKLSLIRSTKKILVAVHSNCGHYYLYYPCIRPFSVPYLESRFPSGTCLRSTCWASSITKRSLIQVCHI